MVACGAPAECPPPALPVGNPGREQPRRDLVAICISDAGTAGRPARLCSALSHADREERRRCPPIAAGTALEALSVAEDKKRGRGRSAGEDRDRATGSARRRSARSLRDDTSDDARKGAARDCCPFARTQPDHRARCAVEAPAGVLRPAPSQARGNAKGTLGIAGEAEAVPSGKLAALMQMVRELASEGRRVLVFLQFTSMLD